MVWGEVGRTHACSLSSRGRAESPLALRGQPWARVTVGESFPCILSCEPGRVKPASQVGSGSRKTKPMTAPHKPPTQGGVSQRLLGFHTCRFRSWPCLGFIALVTSWAMRYKHGERSCLSSLHSELRLVDPKGESQEMSKGNTVFHAEDSGCLICCCLRSLPSVFS